MTTPKPAGWQAMLEKHAPGLLKDVSGLQEKLLADGALPARIKVLMMMLGDSMLAHTEGAANLSRRARALGASEAEIAETLAVAYVMGGLPALVTGANAFRD